MASVIVDSTGANMWLGDTITYTDPTSGNPTSGSIIAVLEDPNLSGQIVVSPDGGTTQINVLATSVTLTSRASESVSAADQTTTVEIA